MRSTGRESDRENDSDLRVFSGGVHPELGRSVCAHLDVEPAPVELCRFDNENVFVRFDEDVSGLDVFLLQSFHFPVNLSIMELLVMADAARRGAARRITAVLPFYAYGRSDSRMQSRVPITARLLADLISVSGVDRVVTVDLHSPQTEGFFAMPVEALTALDLLAEHYRKGPRRVVVAPHEGSIRWAKGLAERLGFPLAVIEKRRVGSATELNLLGSVSGEPVVLIENQIDSGSSLATAATFLKRHGVTGISATATHAVLSAGSVARLAEAPIDEIVVTDTLPVAPAAVAGLPLRVLSVAPLLGAEIERIHRRRDPVGSPAAGRVR